MKKIYYILSLAVAALSFAFVSCTEEIDESSRYTFTGETAYDYIKNNPEYSEYLQLIQQTPIASIQTNSDAPQSTVGQLLAARGNFVVFAPSNDAIRRYLKETCERGVIEPSETSSFDAIRDRHVADSLRQTIVWNSVIDFSQNGSQTFFYINDFAGSSARETNLNYRMLFVEEAKIIEVEDNGETRSFESYKVDQAQTEQTDILVFNGIVHKMYTPVAPSNDDINKVMAVEGSGVEAFAALIASCGLQERLAQIEDEEYRAAYFWNPGAFITPVHPTEGVSSTCPETRLVGFTIFAETDDVYERLGLLDENGRIDIAALKEYLRDHNALMGDEGTNYDDENNWLNQFVTYHILPMRIDYDHLVIHYNELGFRFPASGGALDKAPTITMSEWYQTLGKPRLLKLSDGNMTALATSQYDAPSPDEAQTYNVRLNYFEKMDRKEPWNNSTILEPGIWVRDPSRTTLATVAEPANGKIYPIKELLYYSEHIAQMQGSERMRFDVTSMLPELMTNYMRRLYYTFQSGTRNRGFVHEYPYFENLEYNEDAIVSYLPGFASGWNNYEGDEFNIVGAYDIIIKLPPVPRTATYELRYGVSTNETRGVCQVYFGTNKDALPAAGIPLDLRLGGLWSCTKREGSRWVLSSNVGYEKDTENGQGTHDIENDKRMRLQGFMKAPASWSFNPVAGEYDVMKSQRNLMAGGDSKENWDKYLSTGVDNTYAGFGACTRRILLRRTMNEGEQYYIRFKNVLGDTKSQFFLDYFELVPREVYDNPSNPEDIW